MIHCLLVEPSSIIGFGSHLCQLANRCALLTVLVVRGAMVAAQRRNSAAAVLRHDRVCAKCDDLTRKTDGDCDSLPRNTAGKTRQHHTSLNWRRGRRLQ